MGLTDGAASRAAPAAAALPGFRAGVRCGLRGLGRCVTTPALWPWALVPALLTAGFFAAAFWASNSAAAGWAEEQTTKLLGEGWGTAASWVVTVVVAAVTLVLAYLVFAPIARVLAAPFLAVLSDRTVRTLIGTEPPALARGRVVRYLVVPVRDALVFLGVRLVATVLFLPLLCVPAVGPVLFFLALVPLEGMDRMDVAQSSRGVRLGSRLGFGARSFGACCGLGLVSATLLLVPVVNVLLLPGLVVGAVLLDAEIEGLLPQRAREPEPA